MTKTSMLNSSEDYYITAGTQPHPDIGPLYHKLDLRLISLVFLASLVFFLSFFNLRREKNLRGTDTKKGNQIQIKYAGILAE